MGMNIYKLKKDGGNHIGKRWATGIWCWDCKIKAEHDSIGLFWYCPKCNQRCSEKTLYNPVMRELGFDREKETKHSGVDGANGFIWQAKNKKDALKLLKGIKKVKTEYGKYWSIKRFWIMFNDVIKEDFDEGDFC
jgi:hypothetical protein